MSNPTRAQRILELTDIGLEIWKGHVDDLWEPDKNARLMDKRTFDQLKSNIRKDKRLESLPLVVIQGDKFRIVSGSHRVRAARMAGVTEIYWLLDPKTLSKSEILSKQLAHNALVGYDDPRVLKELYVDIEDLNLQIESGIDPKDFEGLPEPDLLTPESVELDLEFKQITLLFLPENADEFLSTLDLTNAAFIGILQHNSYDRFVDTLRKISEAEDVRNLTATVLKMCEIVKDYYRAIAPSTDAKGFEPRVKLVEQEPKA